jgi:hypothetical protein
LLEPQGYCRDKGLGTNPMGSVQWCASSATIQGCHQMQGCHERRGKERSQKVSRHRTAGHGPVADVTDPSGLAESLLPRVGGWDSKFQRGNDWGSVLTIPPPPHSREGGGRRHGLGRRRPYAGTKATPYILVFFTGPLKPRPHICKPPGRFTRGLTGH